MSDLKSTVAYDCLTCGACCAPNSTGQTYVLLGDSDIRRLEGTGLPIIAIDVQDADPPEVLHALPTKRDANGVKVCIAFNGRAGGTNACSIYEQRPGACRGFEVGGLFCQEARMRLGLPI